MSRGAPPPLRFLALVVGGWVAIRAMAWVGWPDEAARDPPVAIASSGMEAAVAGRELLPEPRAEAAPETGGARRRASRQDGVSAHRTSGTMPRPAPIPAALSSPVEIGTRAAVPAPLILSGAGEAVVGPNIFATPPGSPRRWSASAWLLIRRDGGSPALAPGGILGGSQGGARLLYRLNGEAVRPLALAARVSAPLRGRGAEAALGLDWRPVARLPVHVLAERRQGLDGGGRSAFAASIYGGASVGLPAGARLDAYAQAGAVGLRSRDLFADGAVRVGMPFGPVEIGGGAWGAAQPGAARLDAGPQMSLPLPLAGANLRLSADWRFRLAGDARPSSGPALAIGADF